MISNEVISVFSGILPEINTTDPYSPSALAKANAKPVSSAGNMPMKTEITSLLIITKLEQYDYAGATAFAVVMLTAAFTIMLAINLLQWWSSRHLRTA